MFETLDSAEVPLPTIFGSEGTRMWSSVRFLFHLPWFYVTCCFPVERTRGPCQMLCLTLVDDLLQVTHAEGFKVVEVNVVIPAYMSKKRRWTMEPLAEIWCGVEPGTDGQVAYVYVTSDGARYLHSAVCKDEGELQKLTQVFSAPAPVGST